MIDDNREFSLSLGTWVTAIFIAGLLIGGTAVGTIMWSMLTE